MLTSKMAEIREALKRATDFLVNDVHVKSSDFLPYERQLTALTYVYAMKGNLSPAEVSTIRRWFWRTSFSERYRRGGEGLFDEDLATVLLALEDAKYLERFGKPPTPDDICVAEFRKTSALSNAFVALLASKSPRNLMNGAAIDTGRALSTYNRKEFHHIFPQAYLRDLGVPKNRINSLANICMLSAEQNKLVSERKPSEYVNAMKNTLGADFKAVLESNLIPEASLPFLERDDYAGFLEIRGEQISRVISAHI